MRTPLGQAILPILGLSMVRVASCLGQANLVPDASFESPVQAWFQEDGQGRYCAAKELAADAPDGRHVLAVQGWERAGSVILSPAQDLATNTYSATMRVRSTGKVQGVSVELALFDETGRTKLASFGSVAVDGSGRWAAVEATGVKLARPDPSGRLGIVVSGPQHGARLEVDQVGLFAGSAIGAITDNADFTSFEAEDMADGKAWKVVDHYTGWYSDQPSGMKMLSGAETVAEADNHPATYSVSVRVAGPHRLWTRLMRVARVNHGTYRIALWQNRREIAAREIDDGDPSLGSDYSWVWVPIDANLVRGDAEVVVTRPAAGSSGISRKIDLFVLTNLLDYKPDIPDFRPLGFVRWTNQSTNQAPFCLFFQVRRFERPVYIVAPGILSAAGFSGGYAVPADQTKWIAPGASSPWVNISRYLLPDGGRNNVSILATRNSHVQGLVSGRWSGTLEFAVGEEHRLIRTVPVDQEGSRLWLTLPYDMERQSNEVYTASDYIEKKEAALDKLGRPHGCVATNLDLNVILAFQDAVDDPRVIGREINILKRLGFNGTYTPITAPSNAVAFCVNHGLQEHLGMWAEGFYLMKNGCFYQPDIEKLDAVFEQQAKHCAPYTNKVERMKLCDEPGGPPYEHFQTCEFCRTKFASDLKTQGLTPKDLGVSSWAEVVPVLPADKDKHPELFYYTGLFRLQAFASLARAAVHEKQKYLPANVKTYVNYSPPTGGSWDQRGNDPFFCHRDGAFEMAWTEDWLGYSAAAEQMSPLYAQLRASGAPLGGYMIGVSGPPTVQRIKYYELIAAGARHVNVYNYGPAYASIDSWSENLALYPNLSAVQHELGAIDAALAGATRHPTDIAILYNRTAGIWAYNTSASEQDGRYIHFALAHAGYDADFIPEEDIVAGRLDRYRVLYLNGPQLRRDTAAKIAEWVRGGGALFGEAGAGSRDEFNRPNPALDAVFGAQSRDLKLEQDAGRPRYELRSRPFLDELTSVGGSGAPKITFNQLCYRERLTPAADAVVFLKNKAGEPAGVIHSFGKGTAIRVAASPGLAYLNEAIRGKEFDVNGFLPRNYRPELRDFIAWPAQLAHAYRIAQTTSTPIPELVRYDAKGRAVLFILDHNATPIPKFVMTVFDAGQFRRAHSASGKPVAIHRLKSGALEVSLPLHTSDVVVLEESASLWNRLFGSSY